MKLNHVEPTLKDGEGNVPYARTEYTAPTITAYFNLDLAQLRGYVNDAAFTLLVALAIFKIQRFLRDGLRLRTACDLDAETIVVTRPGGYILPELDEIEAALPALIKLAYSDSPVEKRVTTIRWSGNIKKAKKNKNADASEV